MLYELSHYMLRVSNVGWHNVCSRLR